MSAVRVCTALVLVLAAACADATSDVTPTPPNAPASSGAPQSSVCAAYAEQLATARAALAKTPRDSVLQARVATYQSVFADACN